MEVGLSAQRGVPQPKQVGSGLGLTLGAKSGRVIRTVCLGKSIREVAIQTEKPLA